MPSGAKVAYLNKSRPRTDISDNERGLPVPNAADILSLRAILFPPRPRRLLRRGRGSTSGWWLFSRSEGGEVPEEAAAAAAAAMKAAAAEVTGKPPGLCCWKTGGGGCTEGGGELPSWLSEWCEMVGVVTRGGEHPVECTITGGWIGLLAPPPGGDRSRTLGLCAPGIEKGTRN